MSEKDHDVDPVVPGVMTSLAGQLGSRRITRVDRIITICILALLLVTALFSGIGFTLTQLQNSCQNTSTQKLRDANNSDRQAQDDLDEHLQNFIDSLTAVPPPNRQARLNIYRQEKANYAKFKRVRAQNELIRARTARRC